MGAGKENYADEVKWLPTADPGAEALPVGDQHWYPRQLRVGSGGRAESDHWDAAL